uniref:Uncharacterized protein n=1 Tax=Mandrillus leucophaeus TaxID=9568 RepID=A0A2K5YLT8_MANLE
MDGLNFEMVAGLSLLTQRGYALLSPQVGEVGIQHYTNLFGYNLCHVNGKMQPNTVLSGVEICKVLMGKLKLQPELGRPCGWSKAETVDEHMEEEEVAKEDKEESDDEAAKSDDPMAYIHFTAEGEVTFKSVLLVPTSAPRGLFDEHGSKKSDYIKLYVHCVFITDNFRDMMSKYLNFVKGVMNSDDLPLNVSLETLQQHKLLKVIRKKLVCKTLDMIKKIADEKYNDTFWKEFGTNIKLGVTEDHSNQTRLAKLLMFQSSHHPTDITTLDQYVERMKRKQDKIYFMAGFSRKERLLKKGYEVIYLTEPVDEYCSQTLPKFDGKRFQNIVKEGVKFDESEKTKESCEAVEKEFEPLLNWMKDKALKDKIKKAVVSQHLTESLCALVASQYGLSGNMDRIMKA